MDNSISLANQSESQKITAILTPGEPSFKILRERLRSAPTNAPAAFLMLALDENDEEIDVQTAQAVLRIADVVLLNTNWERHITSPHNAKNSKFSAMVDSMAGDVPPGRCAVSILCRPDTVALWCKAVKAVNSETGILHVDFLNGVAIELRRECPSPEEPRAWMKHYRGAFPDVEGHA